MKTGIFKHKKYWAWLGIIAAVALLCMVLHMHPHEAGHEADCAVCRVVTTAVLFIAAQFILLLTVLFFLRAKNLFVPLLFLFFSFSRRGPPLFSSFSR